MKKWVIVIIVSLGNSLLGQVGTTCENPIIISSLPFTTTDDTVNYADNYDVANPSSSGNGSTICSNTAFAGHYHGGNDVIFAYTPTTSGDIKIEIPNAVAWTGLFVYTSCANITVTAAACSALSTDGARTINNFPVTAGQTYYILISSWAPPQSVPFTLNVTSLNLAIDENNQAKEEVSIFPNPVQHEINFKSQNPIVVANIYTMEGKKLKSTKVKGNKISVESLPTATYIVELIDKLGNEYTKVFIKK